MSKKTYSGLAVTFVPFNGTNIIRASTACSIISVTYYIKTSASSCDTETYEDGLEIGYSNDWNAAPPEDA